MNVSWFILREDQVGSVVPLEKFLKFLEIRGGDFVGTMFSVFHCVFFPSLLSL